MENTLDRSQNRQTNNTQDKAPQKNTEEFFKAHEPEVLIWSKKKPLENYDSLTVVQKKAPSNLLNFTWYSVSENVEEPWSREMTTVPSSTC